MHIICWAIILIFQDVVCEKMVRNTEPCDEEKLLSYLAQLQVINPESIIHLSTLDELPELCNQVEENLSEVEGYLRTCQPSQKDLYIKLINGVSELYKKICTKNYFADEFRKYYTCYQKVSKELLKCNGPEDWNEADDEKAICNYYKAIVECYFSIISEECGYRAADIFKDLTIKVINSILVIHCENVLSIFDSVHEPTTLRAVASFAWPQTHTYRRHIIFAYVYLINLLVA